MSGRSALEVLRSAEIPAKELLAYFAEHFDTFEVDSTYYQLPSESMVVGCDGSPPSAPAAPDSG